MQKNYRLPEDLEHLNGYITSIGNGAGLSWTEYEFSPDIVPVRNINFLQLESIYVDVKLVFNWIDTGILAEHEYVFFPIAQQLISSYKLTLYSNDHHY